MNRNRLWVIVSVIGMVGVLLAGWFFGVSPQLSAAAANDEQRITVDAQNESIRAIVAQLTADEADLPAWKAQLATLQRSIPRDTNASAFIDDINALASSAGVLVSNIAVADAQAYVPPASAAAAAPVDPAAPAPTPAEADPNAPAVEVVEADPFVPPAVTNPLITSENLVLVPVTIQTKGAYDQVLNFVNGLQTGPRLFLVTSFKSQANEEGDAATTGTTTGYIYVLLNQFDPTAAK